MVEAFLTALRAGDFEGLVAVLDPDVVVRIDEAAARPASAREIRGARDWAKGAIAFSKMAGAVEPALINGTIGLILAPGGHLQRALRFIFEGGKISQVDIVGDPEQLANLELGLLDD